MRRYRQPEPQPRGVWRTIGRTLAWAGVAVLVVLVGFVGAAYLRAHQFVEAIGPHTRAERVAAKRLNVAVPGRATVALLIGSDHRGGDPGAAGSRSDTLMLVRADPGSKSISMLSLPRDLLTTIRCPGRQDRVDRINAAFSECGALGSLLTVQALTGLPINYLITVNFHGFVQLVDRLGGIWLDVDQRYFNNHTGPSGYAAINLEPGYQRLRGGDALAYARFRHTDSDIYRTARQQLFLRALKQQVSSSISLTSVLHLISAVESNVTVGRAGGKGIDLGTLRNYLYFAYTLPAGRLFQARIQGLTGYNTLSTSQTDVNAAVQQFAHPDVNAPAKAQQLALGTSSPQRRLKPDRISVSVLNGNGITGSAANAGIELGQRGYRIVLPPAGQPSNAPSFAYPDTSVYFDPGRPDARAAAQQLAQLFGHAVLKPQATPISRLANGALITIIVGHTFQGTLALTHRDQTPKPAPANVTSNLSATLPALRAIRRRLPFPLQAPQMIERNSVLDPAEPVRLYTIVKGHRAVRLTFRSGGLDYWGIEETNWNQAPALQQANFVRRLGRREFDLYYTGPHLHMVVLRWRGASYWVINTLLDTLSNETMLAIARGLVPLHK